MFAYFDPRDETLTISSEAARVPFSIRYPASHEIAFSRSGHGPDTFHSRRLRLERRWPNDHRRRSLSRTIAKSEDQGQRLAESASGLREMAGSVFGRIADFGPGHIRLHPGQHLA